MLLPTAEIKASLSRANDMMGAIQRTVQEVQGLVQDIRQIIAAVKSALADAPPRDTHV